MSPQKRRAAGTADNICKNIPVIPEFMVCPCETARIPYQAHGHMYPNFLGDIGRAWIGSGGPRVGDR